MARSTRSTKLETRSARLRLPVAKKPVFVKIGQSIGLGYRRNQTAGTWVARIADGKGGNWTKAIGAADDFEDADGNTILDFWQAQDKARTLARPERAEAGGSAKPATVEQALAVYEADLKTRGADLGNVARVRMHLPAPLRDRPVPLLASRELRRWRDELVKHLAPASVNRTCTGLKAALNLAAEHDERIANRRAWETGLATIPDAEQSRNVILPEPIVREIIAAAREQSAEFGLLVEVAAVTGARVSQLARIEVQDLQADREAPRLMMPTSKKGKGQKAVQRRPVPLPTSLAAKLRALTAGRPATAPLLAKPSGEPWKKSDHSRLFARATKVAGEDPERVTMYALRHSSIVRQILAGVPIRIVAVNHDTSIAMLERTYSRHIGDHADALARAALLETDDLEGNDNIVPLRGSQ
ncbi:MAG: tyrosine-type recombinase/integrase [Alphaproteobacteria bacterium]